MDARAGWAELGYHFADARWAPTISYRVSYFSGDDPATSAYERWDPLLSGGTGEQWVQGANHFKVVQDSNVVAHHIQARFKMSPRIEVVPQFWAFRADELNNIGGNPALSVLSDDEPGYEANVTVKWFKSKNTYIHGHVAYTVPGSAAKAALGGSAKDWLSVMAFVRYAFRASGRSPPSPQKRGIPMSEPHDSAENLERRALLKVLGAAAMTGGLASPLAAETAQPAAMPTTLGAYAMPWDPADPALPGRQNIVPVPEDYFVPGRFAGKTALVTGCARGMGRLAAMRLAREGANVVGVDWIADEGQAVIDAILSEGGKAAFVQGDISETAVCDAMVQAAVGHFGGLDCALNNAGVMDAIFPGDPIDYASQKDLVMARIDEASDDYWDVVMRVNATGTFRSLRAELRQMLAQGRGGSIVNVASVVGLRGFGGTPSYVASKHAVNGLTKNAAIDYAPASLKAY
ncbi:SDR family oxidoreductase [Paracoccus sp. pheM1]|uniref:SDR family oxidoreductase n=2 Tax=Paracoccaceae TaxID=31989 RepID=UPI001BDB7B14|nr:SDR family oxidoreductase [Paracoccus sp. pheM1]MBT0779049.1 SDR family NAD(P)-dependent oxidoreductase [Paracoccus sp. pheM1]